MKLFLYWVIFVKCPFTLLLNSIWFTESFSKYINIYFSERSKERRLQTLDFSSSSSLVYKCVYSINTIYVGRLHLLPDLYNENNTQSIKMIKINQNMEEVLSLRQKNSRQAENLKKCHFLLKAHFSVKIIKYRTRSLIFTYFMFMPH